MLSLLFIKTDLLKRVKALFLRVFKRFVLHKYSTYSFKEPKVPYKIWRSLSVPTVYFPVGRTASEILCSGCEKCIQSFSNLHIVKVWTSSRKSSLVTHSTMESGDHESLANITSAFFRFLHFKVITNGWGMHYIKQSSFATFESFLKLW